jgi:hypothetical protein
MPELLDWKEETIWGTVIRTLRIKNYLAVLIGDGVGTPTESWVGSVAMVSDEGMHRNVYVMPPTLSYTPAKLLVEHYLIHARVL